jgi:hypothetical protein
VHGPRPQAFRSLGGVELTRYLPRWRGSHIHDLANGWRLAPWCQSGSDWNLGHY